MSLTLQKVIDKLATYQVDPKEAKEVILKIADENEEHAGGMDEGQVASLIHILMGEDYYPEACSLDELIFQESDYYDLDNQLFVFEDESVFYLYQFKLFPSLTSSYGDPEFFVQDYAEFWEDLHHYYKISFQDPDSPEHIAKSLARSACNPFIQ